MIELNAFLLWLICVGISAIAIGYFFKYYWSDSPIAKEGFIVYTCPNYSAKYITKNGETNCCNGDIIDGKCTGNNICSLSPTNSLGLPSCRDYASDLASDAAIANCFADMPYYFEASDGSLKGCSASTTTDDGTAPTDPNKMQCILYPTEALDKVRLDSCYNYNLNKDKLSKPANCPVVPAIQTAPSLISSTFSSVGNQISSVGQQASSAAQSASSSLMGAVGLGSQTESTGYVMYGDGISGNLPVTTIFDAIGPGGSVQGKIFLAQDGNYIRAINTDVAYTKNDSSIFFTGNLSEIDDFAKLNMVSGRVGITRAKYNIKKLDGTGVLISGGASGISGTSTGYVIYGDGISGNLPVTKILDAIGPGGSVQGKIYLAQDGNYIRVIITDVAYTKNDSPFYFTGNLSEINDFAKLNMVSGRVGITRAKYNIKKADGSGILLAQ
uniref:Uncharacterized protein n=1 Tax=viral metagenome TaxID=1070528 RepID=A0A6C0AP11_9ZZZZ